MAAVSYTHLDVYKRQLLAWVIWVAAAPAASDLAIGIFLALAFLYGCWACDLSLIHI